MEKNLHERTMALLRDRPENVSLRKISNDTGLGYEWLRKLLYEGIPDPGVNKIETLYHYLSALNGEAA